MKQRKQKLRLNPFRNAVLICGLAVLLTSCGEKKQQSKILAIADNTEIMEAVITKKEIVQAKATAAQLKSGKAVYMQLCFACHQAEGQGIPGAFPPLAKSDYLNADVDRAIDVVLNGKTGPIKVNGVTYNSVMTPQPLTDEKVADVLTYVYNSWGNSKKVITTAMVKKRRAATKK